MKIEAVAIDLDGTLLKSDHTIGEYTKRILHKVEEMGIKVIIATGRTYKSLYKYKEELELESVVVCYNGAMVYDGKTDERLHEISLKEHVTREIIKIAREHNIHLNLFQDENWYIEKIRKEVEIYKNTSGLDYEMKNFDEFDNLHSTKAMFIAKHEDLLEIFEILGIRFGNDIYKAFSRPHFLEVLDGKVSKGDTLIDVLKERNIDPENVIAFGDGFNDVEMITKVGHGVAMSNAPEGVREVAEYIAESNNDDGVGKFLAKYLDLNLGQKNEQEN